MTKQQRGAIAEAIAIREALLSNPTLDNFARYRRAITTVAVAFETTTAAAILLIKDAI